MMELPEKRNGNSGTQVVQAISWMRNLMKMFITVTLFGQVAIFLFVAPRLKEFYSSLTTDLHPISKVFFYQSQFWLVFLVLAVFVTYLLFATKIFEKVPILFVLLVTVGVWVGSDMLAIFIPYFTMIGAGLPD